MLKIMLIKNIIDMSLTVLILSRIADQISNVIDMIILGAVIVFLNALLAVVWTLFRMGVRLLHLKLTTMKKGRDQKAKEIISDAQEEIEKTLKDTEKKVEVIMKEQRKYRK